MIKQTEQYFPGNLFFNGELYERMISLSSLKGLVAASGIAFGKAYKLSTPDLSYTERTIDCADEEMNRLQVAVEKARREIQLIRKQVAKHQGEEHAAIFDSHLLMLEDPYYMGTIEEIVKKEKVNVESALVQVTKLLITTFKQLNNLYIRERIADIQDVVDRILAHLLGKSLPNISLIQKQAIIVAPELKPSETVQIDKQYVQGFVTENGGKTSHAAIIARSLEISAIVGAKGATTKINHGDYLIVDGINGIVIVNPCEDTIAQYKKRKQQFSISTKDLTNYKHIATKTVDHYNIDLHANANYIHDLDRAIDHGSDGIGLFRSEFLFMESSRFPTEQEQYDIYKNVLQRMKGKPVVIRTLDIGGDKQLPYFSLPEEMNPFLGLRSIRFTLKEKELFTTQLRALLRASHYGNLKIMFPMITTTEELFETKQLLEEVKTELNAENVKVSENIEIGMMIETPAAAITADLFIDYVDFFSIGTNDLIQYTVATDRMNENVSHLYEPLHPAVLRLIKHVIDTAKDNGKWVKICGEMASDERAIPLLLGFGLTSYSMDPSSILIARKLMNSLSIEKLKPIAQKALQLNSAKEVEKLLVEHNLMEPNKNRHYIK